VINSVQNALEQHVLHRPFADGVAGRVRLHRFAIVSTTVIATRKMTSRTDSHAEPSIEVRLLGSPAVLAAGEPLSVPSRKATALLAYLAMRSDEPISRDHLAGLLWGESSNEQARANLRRALTQLRRVFRGSGLDPIKTPGDTVVLSSDGLSIDAHRLARADSIPDPDRLHCDNEFLEGFSLSEPEFERWLTVQRESLRRRVRQLHEAAAEDAFQERRMDEAIDHLTIALSLDPLQEHIHRRLMKLFVAQGRTDAAVGQFERCRAALGQELGIQPDDQTTVLYEKIRSQRMPMENPPAMVLDRPSIAALALKLTTEERERVYRRDTENLEAYEHFLRGREHAFRDTQEANVQARVMLEKAIALDAQFSLAFSHLSRNHVIAYVNRWGETADQSLELAMELGQHAVELDETNPHAYFAVGAAALWTKQHERAAVAAKKSLAIDPNFAEGHAVLGLILVYSGKPRDAIASLHKAMRLDPHYRDIYLHLLALAHVQLEEYEQAVALLKRRLVRKPESDISRVLLAATYGHMGDVGESRAEWAEALRINPEYSLEHRRKILPYENPADFEHLLDGLRKAGLAK